ncbi:putative AlkP superfamily pyrophosphatase or phosphodiesterase [Peribacillus simplex]|nr:putative AlkP superfamily pyrophosphatase or phosphodiesterase [Peribacillus simplex]
MSNKVIAIIVDGMRYDKACEALGFIQHLVETNLAALYKVKSELKVFPVHYMKCY